MEFPLAVIEIFSLALIVSNIGASKLIGIKPIQANLLPVFLSLIPFLILGSFSRIWSNSKAVMI